MATSFEQDNKSSRFMTRWPTIRFSYRNLLHWVIWEKYFCLAILRSVGYGTLYIWLVTIYSRVHNEALMLGVSWYCDYPTGSSAFEIWPV